MVLTCICRLHLKETHRCDCDPPVACRNPFHLSDAQISSTKETTKRDERFPGQAWKQMYRGLYPEKEVVPGPFIPSLEQVNAVFKNPSPETSSQYVGALEAYANSLGGHVSLLPDALRFEIMENIIRETGAVPYTGPQPGQP